MQDDQEGHVRGARPADEPAHVGRDVGRQGARAGHPQAEAVVDGEAAVQLDLPEGGLWLWLWIGRVGCFFVYMYLC